MSEPRGDQGRSPAPADERRIVTVLFADVVGSTALGEEIDPEEMRGLLGRFYDIARDIIAAHGGILEKFIGDAVMAVFGLPAAHGDDAERALAAALAMRDRIHADPLGERLAIRFGVSTGEVVASRDRSAGDFLITGDAVNVAARMQQAAEPWSIIASDRTARAAHAEFEFAAEIQVAAKGKSAPVSAREVLGRRKTTPLSRVRLPLIGRGNDLDQLKLVARRVLDDSRPSLVSVIAPAGTGKTRLLEEFLDWLPTAAPGAAIATAQCLPYGQQLTYWPMRQVLFTLADCPEDAAPAEVRESIMRWLTDVGAEDADRNAELLAATVGMSAGETADRDLLFAAWRSTFETVARRAPLVIVFEDLHWSSDSLLDLAEFVMQPRGSAAVLMIALARPELLDRRPNWGGGRGNHLTIALEPLGETAIADLVRQLLDTDAPDVVKLVAERSEGNPFYAGELVRSYLEHGSLQRLPDTVQATVLARLDLLPTDERRVLQLGSVFGRSFRPVGVVALQPDLAGRVDEMCESLAERDLVRPGDGDRVAFRHILIQEVAYGTLPRAERARLHADAGRWVETASVGREIAVAEILAFHYREAAALAVALDPNSSETARVRDSAATWLIRAAEVAAAAGATPEGARHYRAAFDFVDPELLPRMHERIGDLTAGDTGLEEYRQALELYEAAGAPVDDRLRALAGMLMVLMRWQGSVGGRPTEEWMDSLRARGHAWLEQAQDPRTIGRFLGADAFYPFWLQAYREPPAQVLADAKASARRAADIAAELDDPELASIALDALGGCATVVFDWPAVLDVSRRRIVFEDRIGLYERIDAHAGLAWASILLGDLASAERDSGAMVGRLLPGQAPYPALHLYAWRTLALTLLGHWDEATTMLWRSLEAWNDAGRLAAGYALRGLVAGVDVGRARRDGRLVNAASEAISSIVARFPGDHIHQRLARYGAGQAGFTPDEKETVRPTYPPEMAERRLSLASDSGQDVSDPVLESLLQRALAYGYRPLEAQIRRYRGLARRDPVELSAAIQSWQPMGALPNLGRGRVELGLITGDRAETEAGIAILRALGDVDYLDRMPAVLQRS